MSMILGILLALLLAYLGFSTIYLLLLAVSYAFRREWSRQASDLVNRFAVIVPAHNEELLIGALCESLLQIDYPEDSCSIYIVVDNCTDSTAEVCDCYDVKVLQRNDPDNAGKGQALAWALEQIDLEQFDAVFIVDADNYVDGQILNELNMHINSGEQAIQCYNAVGNREDSWFTQLLYVSRVISNELCHEAKYRLGLSSYLMGNGLCFSANLLKQKGWTAFSAGEDWEYYAQLIESGTMIGFASKAQVFHQESKSLNQATSQRLRWSSGRFSIARTLGLRLFLKGIREKKFKIIDASFPLLLPNYSLLINLSFVGLILSLLLPDSMLSLFLILFLMLLIGQFLLFLIGTIIAGSPLKTFKAALYVPFFLIWKASIDLLCITGLYRGDKWVRTRRH